MAKKRLRYYLATVVISALARVDWVPDYSQFKAVADNDRASVFHAGAISIAVMQTALAELENYWNWKDSGLDLTVAQWDEIQAAINSAQWALMDNYLIGTLYWTVRETLPSFVLPLDGSTFDAVDFPLLFEILPEGWKDGESFTLPDWRGKFPIIPSPAYGFGDTGGETTHVLSENEMPIHSHYYNPPVFNVDLESPGAPDLLAAGVGLPTTTGTAGGGQAHNNMPPYVGVNVGIVAW
jgi:microcystin-dependent protein